MYIITSKTRSRMKRDRNSQTQIQQERKEFYLSQGIGKIQPLKGQSEDEIFEDIKNNQSKVKEQMAEEAEKKKKQKEVKLKETREKKLKSMKGNFGKLIEKHKAGKK